MGWTETKAKAQRVTHSTFALPAVYTSPAAVVTACNVRPHSQNMRFGDLDREGFAVRSENVTRIIVNATEITPERKGKIAITGGGTYRIDNILERDGDNIPCEVVLL